MQTDTREHKEMFRISNITTLFKKSREVTLILITIAFIWDLMLIPLSLAKLNAKEKHFAIYIQYLTTTISNDLGNITKPAITHLLKQGLSPPQDCQQSTLDASC
eukprot:Gb_22953 [translate_table: standard]